MSGKPAVRMGDATLKGGPIVQGSMTVLIGSQAGVGCSVCPGGVTVGSPVNPVLGAKVLDGADELDVSLPGALSFNWQRQYSSYANAETGMRCGLHGYGWTTPTDVELELTETAVRLFDARGRVITFDEPLAAGGALYSESEDLWLVRGCALMAHPSTATPEPSAHADAWYQQAHWQHIPEALRTKPQLIFAASGSAMNAGGSREAWMFGPRLNDLSAVSTTDTALGRRVLHGLMDRFGRRQIHHRDADGQLTGISDGVGRRFDLLIEQTHKTKTARNTPDGYQIDSGKRLTAILLAHDPYAASYANTRFGGSAGGATEAPATQTRPPLGIEYDTEHRIILARRYRYKNHLMTGHSRLGDAVDASDAGIGGDGEDSGVAGQKRASAGTERFAHQYVYERYEPGGRVIEQLNVGELSYRFDYHQPTPLGTDATVVTDSLHRTETYHFEGEGGLKRAVAHTRADGSQRRYRYDAAGRKVADIDPLGRATYYRLDPDGKLLGTQGPDGAQTKQSYATNAQNQHQSVTLTNAEGLTTRFDFDEHGRMLTNTAADSSVNRYQYPALIATSLGSGNGTANLNADNPHTIIDASGKKKHLNWTPLGQLESYIDCSGKRARYRYNAEGQLAETTNAESQTTRYRYHDYGALAETRYPDLSFEQYHYDDAQRLIAVIPYTPSGARAGDSVSVTRDANGRINSRNHAGLALGYEYDIAGRLTTLVNENLARTKFSYSLLDQLTEEIGFDERAQTYRYDLAEQLTEMSERNLNTTPSSRSAAATAALTYRYDYDKASRLIARHVPALGNANAHTFNTATVQRFDYAKSGALLRVAVYPEAIDTDTKLDVAQAQAPNPLSEVIFNRDTLGRIQSETQTLFDEAGSGNALFTHSLAHRYDEIGALTHTTLPSGMGLSAIHYQRYGSGHLHGIALDDALGTQSVIDFERDHLHRETERTLHTLQPTQSSTPSTQPPSLKIERELVVMGRLLTQRVEMMGVPAQAPAAPEPRIPAIPNINPQSLTRHYRYNALGQLTDVRADKALASALGMNGMNGMNGINASRHYDYDPTGRLVAATDPRAALEANLGAKRALDPTASLSRFRFDAAGNRLSSHPGSAQNAASSHNTRRVDRQANDTDSGTDGDARQAALIEAMKQPDFNPLYGDITGKEANATPDRWPDNRIHAFDDMRYQYDAFGNRIGAETKAINDAASTLDTQKLTYDGLHQLIAIERYRLQDGALTREHTRYRYDALGRRMAKIEQASHAANATNAANATPAITYYGWEGDRLVHTETDAMIERTVYEPESFVPILKLTKSKATQVPSPMQLMMQMATAREGSETESDNAEPCTVHADHIADLSKAKQDQINAMLLHAMNDPKATAKSINKFMGNSASTTQALGVDVNADANQSPAPIEQHLSLQSQTRRSARQVPATHSSHLSRSPRHAHRAHCS